MAGSKSRQFALLCFPVEEITSGPGATKRIIFFTILPHGHTVFIRLNAAASTKFSAFLMRCLYKGGVCLEITFLKSLTTVTVNRFLSIMYFKGSNVSVILLT